VRTNFQLLSAFDLDFRRTKMTVIRYGRNSICSFHFETFAEVFSLAVSIFVLQLQKNSTLRGCVS